MADPESRRDGLVATFTLNRPDRLDAVSDEMLRAMLATLEELASDTEVGVVVLTRRLRRAARPRTAPRLRRYQAQPAGG